MKSIEVQLLLLLTAQIIFLAAMLLVRRRVKPAVFLLLLIEALSIQTLMKVINKTWLMETFQQFYYLGYDIPFLFGPLLLMFVLAKLSVNNTAFSLLLPFAAGIALSWFRVDILTVLGRDLYFCFFSFIGVLQLIYLLYCASSALRRIRVADVGATAHDTKWCRNLVIATSILGSFLIIYLRIAYIFSPFLYLPAIYMPFFVALIAMSIHALHEPEGPGRKSDIDKPKYIRSALTDLEIAELCRDLDMLMETKRPIVDPALSIDRMAEMLGTSRHKLSQLLNQVKGKTYSDYINELRIEQAKRLLTDPHMHQFTLQAVAERAGFNSYTTFFQVFKKFVGLSPYDYKMLKLRASNGSSGMENAQIITQINQL